MTSQTFQGLPWSRRLLALAALAPAAAAALAQTTATPHEAVHSPPDKSEGTLIIHGAPADTNEALKKALTDLGESPLAAIYEAAGPDVRAFAQHNMVLASPFFEGRVPGSRGNRMAADYIEFYFQKAGLKPAFSRDSKAADGSTVIDFGVSYRQPFSRGNEIKVEEAQASFDLGPEGIVKLKPEQFSVLGSSGSGVVTAPIVLVGYGIAEGQEGYTNYPEG